LKLNRGKFTKKSTELIRRQFLIDARAALDASHPLFRNHIGLSPETRRSPSALIGGRPGRRKRRQDTVFCRNLGLLSVRLMSL
jgi:hypothetical protein